MSPAKPDAAAGRPHAGASAHVFAALGDPTRLGMVARLCRDGPLSIARLTAGSQVTRQAVAKHLQVLASAGLVRGHRRGRESLWELEPRRLEMARRYLDLVSKRWDDTLGAAHLREVCGLTTEEIARAFLAPAPTLAQRIVRAKAKIRQARIPRS